jgi:hypothetical protein
MNLFHAEDIVLHIVGKTSLGTLCAIVLVGLVGCRSAASGFSVETPPFDQYGGRDVVLRRPVKLTLLNDWVLRNSFTSLSYPNDRNLNENLPPMKEEKLVLLAAGRTVHVRGTGMVLPDVGMRFAYLWTFVDIKDAGEGWPQQVTAVFNNAYDAWFLPPGSFHWFGPPDAGDIRPAPWEPLDTPEHRQFSWPAADSKAK